MQSIGRDGTRCRIYEERRDNRNPLFLQAGAGRTGFPMNGSEVPLTAAGNGRNNADLVP